MTIHLDLMLRRVSAGRPRRLLAALLLAALLTGAGASRAVAAEPGVGVSVSSGVQLSTVKQLGTHWVRMFVSWRSLEPTRAGISLPVLASFEQAFKQLPAGTKVIVDVVGTPEWETGSSNEYTPPTNPNEYAAFVGALAQHWAGQVTAFEIWNEEDDASFWVGGPNPAAYAQLLKATYPVVKAADPSATVVLGGLTGNDYPFLEEVYAAGAKGSFDVVAVHTDTACNVLSPYVFLRGANGRMVPDSFLAYREVHATMLANGDDKPIWMTELSWRTTTATCASGAWAGQKPQGVSDAEQATFLSQAYHCLAEDSYVQVALWFALQDEGVVVSGLMRADGSHKPSFAAMRTYARDGDQLGEPCGVFTGPQITVASPADHSSYEGPLPIDVSAKSSQGVYRIKLEIDGRGIRNYGTNADPPTLDGVIDWQGAKHISVGWHTLTFIAYDKELNSSSVSLEIYHRALGNGGGGGSHHGKPKKTGRRHAKPKKKRHHGTHH